MSSTFLYDTPKRKTPQVALGYDQFGGIDDGGPTAIPGDGGIYSTVDDLFKWDQALYTDRLVRQSTLSEAFHAGQGPRRNFELWFRVECRGGGRQQIPLAHGQSSGF